MEASSDAYMKRLASSFVHLRESGKLCDTVLVTADRQLLAHSIVLAAASPVFLAAFQICANDGCTSYRLQLDGIDGQLMEAVLNSIYCGHGTALKSFSSTADAKSVAEICEQLGVSWITEDKDSINLVHCNQQAKSDNCPSQQLSENCTDGNVFTDNTATAYDTIYNIKVETTSSSYSAAEVTNSSVTSEQCLFTCDICSRQFSTGAALRQHRSCHKDCATCTECGHSFSSSAILSHHSIMQCLRKLVTCNICLEWFKGWPSLSRHTTATHQEANVCHLCGQAFQHFDQLLAHRPVHATNFYRCRTCSQSFTSCRRAKRHVRKHERDCENCHVSSRSCLEEINGNEWFSVSPVNVNNRETSAFENWNISGDAYLTGYSFDDVNNDTHISYQQKEITAAAWATESQVKESDASVAHRLIQIPLADCSFPTSNRQINGHHIMFHLDNQHQQNSISVPDALDGKAAKQGRVTCGKCYRTFKRLADLHVHMRCHTGEMRYKCNVCNRPFRKNGTLARHMRIHTGERPYVCETCGKSYKLLFHLHLHMTVHSSDRPFACDVCGKSFQSAASLKKHRFVHSGVKPFSCPICTRLFNRRSNMHAHMRVHDSARQHEVFGQEHVCILCRKKFGSMATLQQHLQTHARQIELDVGETITADSSAEMTYCKAERQRAEDVFVAMPLVHFDDFDVS